jgi:uncharacterized protein YndB with AHSA1/START domain
VFEAVHSERIDVPASVIWELWQDTDRWPDWNEQIQEVEVDGEEGLQLGAKVKTKMRRGGTVRHVVTEYEAGTVLVYEARFPGARTGLEHRLREGKRSVEVTHRRYVEGPLASLWAPMIGRKRMAEAVERLIQRERELTQSSSGRA